jgi:hypothetical protein
MRAARVPRPSRLVFGEQLGRLVDAAGHQAVLGIGRFMPKPRPEPGAETRLAFGSALAGFFLLFGCRSSRFRVSEFVLGLRLRLPRTLRVIFCLFRLFGRSSSLVLCSL